MHKGLESEGRSYSQHQAQSQAAIQFTRAAHYLLKTHNHICSLLSIHCTAYIMQSAGVASPALGTRAALLPRHLARKSSMAAGGIRAASRKHDSHDQSSQQVGLPFRKQAQACAFWQLQKAEKVSVDRKP